MVVLEEHLFLMAGIVLVVATAMLRSRVLVGVTLAFVGWSLVIFGSEWVSIPALGRSADLTVMSWNLERGARAPSETVEALRSAAADVIALQELEPDQAAAIESDPVLGAGFPYRALVPHDGYLGVGLLSRYPLRDVARMRGPAAISATVGTPSGPFLVVNAHPLPGRIATATPLRIPIGFDPSVRDADIERLRSLVDAAVARNERVLVIGDFNTSPTEPAYDTLAEGLTDVHVEVGQGPGWTWRPSRLESLPLGLLRLDLALVSVGIVPVSAAVDCSLPGDHCQLLVELRIEGSRHASLPE